MHRSLHIKMLAARVTHVGLLAIAVASAIMQGACSAPREAPEPIRLPHVRASTDLCTEVVCPPSSDPCQGEGICNPLTGVCAYAPGNDGAACEDNDPCSQNDVCQAGICVGGPARSCPAAGLCQEEGTCVAGVGCVYPSQTNETPCGDNDACTLNDRCQDGVCAGVPKACPAPDTCHQIGQCNPADGTCSYIPKQDGTACDPGNAGDSLGLCEVAICVAGACLAQPLVCLSNNPCMQAGICDPATGQCAQSPMPDGVACDDGDPCSQDDVCRAGTCLPGALVTCAPKDTCHSAGVCVPGQGCTDPIAANGTPCENSNPCSQNDVCQAGVCIAGPIKSCPAQDDCHNEGICDANTGACLPNPKPNNVACNDNNACTQSTRCIEGLCTEGIPIACPEPGPCQQSAVCDPQLGCVLAPKPDGESCDDNSLCTENDQCKQGTCQGSINVFCPPLDACFEEGICEPSTGECSAVPRANGAPCDDADPCTQPDTCQDSICTGGAPKTCASQACLQDTRCEPGSGACVGTERPSGTPCDDGDPCSIASACTAGVCAAQEPVVCAAKSSCRAVGVCDSATGQCTQPLQDTAAPSDKIRFANIAATHGANFLNTTSDPLALAGAALADFDGDGIVDILVAASQSGLALYLGTPQSLGAAEAMYRDGTQASGLAALNPNLHASGVLASDFDNDGDADVWLLGRWGARLLRNDGLGFFEDVSVASGVGLRQAWEPSAAIGDFNRDGRPDIYIAGYLNTDTLPSITPERGRLLMGQEGGTFVDVSQTMGIGDEGATLAAMWLDVDGDGFDDLWICNDHGVGAEQKGSRLWRNRGTAAIGLADRFEDATDTYGLDGRYQCHSLAMGDLDGDGRVDVHASHLGAATVLRNRGAGSAMASVATAWQLAGDQDPCPAENPLSTQTAQTISWGAAIADFDLDGWLDVFVARGNDVGLPQNVVQANDVPHLLFRNLRGDAQPSTFAEIATAAGVGDSRPGRGVAVGDLDGDGDVDVVQTHGPGGLAVWRNENEQGHKSVQLSLQGTHSSRDALGAVVWIQTPDGRRQRHEVQPYGALGSSHDRVRILGLGQQPFGEVAIEWPSGLYQDLGRIDAGGHVEIYEPSVTIASLEIPTEPLPADATQTDVTVHLSVPQYGRKMLGVDDAPLMQRNFSGIAYACLQNAACSKPNTPVQILGTLQAADDKPWQQPNSILIQVPLGGGNVLDVDQIWVVHVELEGGVARGARVQEIAVR